MGRKGGQRKISDKPVRRNVFGVVVGRSFVHPLFDYLLIGGALSLVVTSIVASNRLGFSFTDFVAIPYIILLSNSAHFAASTVRLYTKPGSYDSLPLLTMAFPLVAAGVLTLCMLFPGRGQLGPHLTSLYLTWSPYHYAAQSYGLAVMYCFRSGCMLSPNNKRLLWWVSMLAFFYAFVQGHETGLQWISRILPGDFVQLPIVGSAIVIAAIVLKILAYTAPFALFIYVGLCQSGPMPLISLLLVVTNGIWWILLPTKDAFIWATIFHGIQYLAIVIIFHLKDQMNRPDNRHGTLYHVVWFYAACVLLGYGLFQCLPWAYEFAGFGRAESILLVVAAINIHHFIVDGYIWRLKKGDTNRRIVESGQPAPA